MRIVDLANACEVMNAMRDVLVSPNPFPKDQAETLLRTATKVYEITDARIPKELLARFNNPMPQSLQVPDTEAQPQLPASSACP